MSAREPACRQGIWSDQVTLWVADEGSSSLTAWDLASGDRAPDRDFILPANVGLSERRALWSNGLTMWVTSANEDKVYAFNMPPAISIDFGADSHAVTEGEAVTVTVNLSADPRRRVAIPLTRTLLEGASADDYSGVPDSLVFETGDVLRTFTFTAIDDLLDDEGEGVKLSFETLPYRVSAGTASEIAISITDNDDAPDLVLSGASVTVPEGEAASYTVALAAPPTADVTVTVSGSSGTDVALSGLDARNRLTFTSSDWGHGSDGDGDRQPGR